MILRQLLINLEKLLSFSFVRIIQVVQLNNYLEKILIIQRRFLLSRETNLLSREHYCFYLFNRKYSTIFFVLTGTSLRQASYKHQNIWKKKFCQCSPTGRILTKHRSAFLWQDDFQDILKFASKVSVFLSISQSALRSELY